MNGKRMRKARKNKGMTLRDLSGATDLTIGFLSQLENNANTPSISSLRKISKALNCPEIWLLQEDSEEIEKDEKTGVEYGRMMERLKIRKDNRITLRIPENTTDYEIFTPSYINQDTAATMTGAIVTIRPHEWVSEQMLSHTEYDESVLLLERQMEVFIESYRYTLYEGDSIYIPKGKLHNFYNPNDTDIKMVIYYSTLIY